MQTQKATTGKANPLPVVLSLTVSARMVRSFPVRKVAIPPRTLLPLPPWPGLFACDRLTAIDLFVRHQKRRAMHPPPQDDLWVVVKNLSQQFAAQQTELATLSNAFALQQKTIADLEKINRDLEKVLSNMASQMRRPPSKDTRFADAVKNGPPINSWLNDQPDFRKAGAAAWARSEARDIQSLHTVHRKWSSPRSGRGLSFKSFKAWVPRSEGSTYKDKLAAISFLLLPTTVTTIKLSPDYQSPGTYFRSLLASIGGQDP
ncbi:hypothetical protein BASA84_001146 [Batrachochytrium salamandrivorans]|nr:hypothetical protein BASA84_001146 [Batrachochytrium salamandrivorans]